MKTKEELQELKNEVEELVEKLKELDEEELSQVTGGIIGGADGPTSIFLNVGGLGDDNEPQPKL